MTWQIGAALNATIAGCYLVISWVIMRGLWRTNQMRTNLLALATGSIFFTCAVHHGGHTLHVLLPLLGVDSDHGLAMRRAITWQMDAWDVVGAAVAIFYVTLRRQYARLLHQPEMFENAERQRYELRLERERASLADAQAVANLGSWSWHPDERRLEWSAELFRVLGLPVSEGEPPNAEALRRIHPEDAERVGETMTRAVRTGEVFELDFRIVLPEAGTRHVHAIGHPEDTGSYVGTVQDVTERRRTEEALSQVEERLRVTVSHAPIGMALVDLEEASRGRLLNVNDALAELVGYTREELGEMSLTSIVHPDDVTAVARDLTLLGTDAQARVQLEARCLHRHGQIVWAVLTGASVPAEASERRSAVFHLMDIGERKRFEGQLQYLADHDALTGLFNRRRFEEELIRTLAHSARYGSCGAILMIDLDGFKFVNDTLGHSYGDELVTRVGGLLREALRETDVLARLGGDEFAVIVPEADEAEALIVSEKILAILRERAVVLSESRHARVTASIGVTTFAEGLRLTAEELMVEADIAMYEAKERGKNQAAVYARADDPHQRLIKRQSWLERLRDASDEGRFELMAQPISGIGSDTREHFELLLRLRGENDELIPPGTFLYIAERFDLIQQIDRWVFEQALRLLQLHEQSGHDITLSVNMSGKTIGDPRLLEDITELLRRYPVRADRLVVEVTETAAIVNIERARAVARRLRELGCRFALDDFGAGFASFYYLKHLDFDLLKIDGEFIKALNHNVTDQLVVKSVVDIARGLNVQTVAEYVGDQETVARLAELGVDLGQGYFLGRPAPIGQTLPALCGR